MRASSKPPPKATPSMTAMVGIGKFYKKRCEYEREVIKDDIMNMRMVQ